VRNWLSVVLVVALGWLPGSAFAEQKIFIDKGLYSVDTFHNGKRIAIHRGQDPRATVMPAFSFTSRKCPPFCIQPFSAGDNVTTIAEMELLGKIRKKGVLLVDVRRHPWIKTGTIPGAVNLPWVTFRMKKGKANPGLGKAMAFLGATQKEGGWDFTGARPVILFDNGIWDGKARRTVKSLLKLGYPPQKIFWYRQGMQGWHILGLNHVNTANSRENYLKYNF